MLGAESSNRSRTKSRINAVAYLSLVALAIWGMSRIKRQQEGEIAPPPSPSSTWKYITDDPQLRLAFERDDGEATKTILARSPKGSLGANLVIALAKDRFVHPLQAALSLGWDPNGPAHDGLPLIVAVGSGEVKAVQALLEAGANPSLIPDRGSPALIRAVHQRHESAALTKLLLEYHAPVDLGGGFLAHSESPLACACFDGHIEAAKLLIEHGATIKPKGGEADLLMTAGLGRSPVEAVQLLLDHHANPNAMLLSQEIGAAAGSPPVEVPIIVMLSKLGKGNVVKLLLSRGADPHKKGGGHKSAIEVATGTALVVFREAGLR